MDCSHPIYQRYIYLLSPVYLTRQSNNPSLICLYSFIKLTKLSLLQVSMVCRSLLLDDLELGVDRVFRVNGQLPKSQW